MNTIDFQIVSKSKQLPSESLFKSWMDAVLTDKSQESEIVIRIVDENEMIQFNQQYRSKKSVTNILSFPFDPPEETDSHLLGDLLICAPVLQLEAQQQNKALEHHWAHMVIHGLLHLIGYDHIDDADAEEMETLEIKILKTIKIDNPYEEQSSQ